MPIQTNITDNNKDFSFNHSESGIVLAGPYTHHLTTTPLFTQGSLGTSPLSCREQNDKWSTLLLLRCSCPAVQFVSILQRREGQVTQLTDSLWGWARRPKQVHAASRPVVFVKTAYSWIHKPEPIASQNHCEEGASCKEHTQYNFMYMKFKNRGLLGGAQVAVTIKRKARKWFLQVRIVTISGGGGRCDEGGGGSTEAYAWLSGLDVVAGYGVSNL